MIENDDVQKKIAEEAIQELRHSAMPPFDRVIRGVISYHIGRNRLELSYNEIERIFEVVRAALPKTGVIPSSG